jgi:hypothetical protein
MGRGGPGTLLMLAGFPLRTVFPMTRTVAAVALALAVAGCAPEIRIGAAEGVPRVAGTNDVDLGDFSCGQTVADGEFTVTTRAVFGGCELSFSRQLQVLSAADARNLKGAGAAGDAVTAIDLEIQKFQLADAQSGTPLAVSSLTLLVEGTQIADTLTLAKLPATARLSGAALSGVRTAVSNETAAHLSLSGVAVVGAVPAALRIDYAVQPVVVLGIPGLSSK